jgi:hypothetical protein
MPLTLIERTVVAAALHTLRGRSSDVALLCSLPLLALEVAVRSTVRAVVPERGAAGAH